MLVNLVALRLKRFMSNTVTLNRMKRQTVFEKTVPQVFLSYNDRDTLPLLYISAYCTSTEAAYMLSTVNPDPRFFVTIPISENNVCGLQLV